MLFKSRSREPAARRHVPAAEALDTGTVRCPGLETAVRSVLRRPKPAILDLGPMCGATVTYLASLGARVTVAEFEPPHGSAERAIILDYADQEFDMVLAWEQLDFTPPDRLEDLAVELHRVLKVGGWLYLLSLQSNGTVRDRRARYRLGTLDCVAREPVDEAQRSRWPHSSRTLQRSLAGFCIEGVHLWRNQVREIAATRKGLDLAEISRLSWNNPRPAGLGDDVGH